MKRPFRLLMTGDALGGIWTYSRELIRSLGQHGFEVALAVMGPSPTVEQREQVDELSHVHFFHKPFALEWMKDPWEHVEAAGKWLLGIAKQLEPDLVHLNGYVHATLPWQVPKLVVAHSWAPARWQAVNGASAPLDLDEYRRRTAAGLQAADLVVAPTSAMLAELESEFGPLGSTRIIPHGRDARFFGPREKAEMILSSGRLWDEAKNFGLLDAVASRISWPVFVTGECWSRMANSVEIRDLKVLGPQSESLMAALLGRSAIFASPSLYQPFGFSTLEAGLSGCALVLSDLPSLREIWQDAAIFVPPRNRIAWRTTMEELCSDPDRRQCLGAQAQSRACEFSSEKMVTSYLEVYRELAGLSSPIWEEAAST